MRILIVGSSSKLGKYLGVRLSLEAQVEIAGRSSEIIVDVADKEQDITIPTGTDVVVNCAASFNYRDVSALCESTEVNVVGPLRLVDACSKAGVQHFIHISSIFASMSMHDPRHTAYSLQKFLADELLIRASEVVPTRITSLRPAALLGPGDFARIHQPFLFSIIEKASSGFDIVFSGKHDAARNYLYVEDLAEILYLVIKEGVSGVHDCPGTTYTYSQIATAAVAAFGTNSSISFDLLGTNFPDDLPQLDHSLYKLINFSPVVTLEEVMNGYVNSFGSGA